MKDSILIAPLGLAVARDSILSAALRVTSRDSFEFAREQVSGNPDVKHTNITTIDMILKVPASLEADFKDALKLGDEVEEEEDEDIEDEEDEEGDEDEEEDEESDEEEIVEIRIPNVIEPIVRETMVAPLTESPALRRAIQHFEGKSDIIIKAVRAIEDNYRRITDLTNRLTDGTVAAPSASDSLSDLVPQAANELSALNAQAIQQQANNLQASIAAERDTYDAKLTSFEEKVFSKVENSVEYPASVEAFKNLKLDDHADTKKIVGMFRNTLIAL